MGPDDSLRQPNATIPSLAGQPDLSSNQEMARQLRQVLCSARRNVTPLRELTRASSGPSRVGGGPFLGSIGTLLPDRVGSRHAPDRPGGISHLSCRGFPTPTGTDDHDRSAYSAFRAGLDYFAALYGLSCR